MQRTENTEHLKRELARMARTGSPEELNFRAELANSKKENRTNLTDTGNAKAEREWQKAQSGNSAILVFFILLSPAVYGLQIGAELVGSLVGVNGIAMLVVLVGLGIYGLVRNNKNHRQAYINLQMSKGMSEMDAFRAYEKKYSG